MSQSLKENDDGHMAAALALAGRALGRVWPNPAVGCVIVRDGRVVGRGWTQPGGRPHAETEALARAGPLANGATLYVTLEPCNHHGQTPPCAEAVIDAGVARCVVAVTDPDGRTAGAGLARMRQAGLAVDAGLREADAADLNAGFFLRCRHGRPLITLKTATSLDGRIATRTGESQWITGEQSRRFAHGLRATHDAVLIGSETALADDPDLGCRLPGMADRSPVRLVADGRLRLPLTSRLVKTARDRATWVITRKDANPARCHDLRERGVQVLFVESGVGGDARNETSGGGDARNETSVGGDARNETSGGGGAKDKGDSTGGDGMLDPRAIARTLGAQGLTRVLLEGGGRLAASFLRADLIDRVAWFRAGIILGADAVPAVGMLALDALATAPAFAGTKTILSGDDVLETLTRTR